MRAISFRLYQSNVLHRYITVRDTHILEVIYEHIFYMIYQAGAVLRNCSGELRH